MASWGPKGRLLSFIFACLCLSKSLLFIIREVNSDEGYVGYTRGHLHEGVKGHKHQSFSISKHYNNMHGKDPNHY